MRFFKKKWDIWGKKEETEQNRGFYGFLLQIGG
jgi:hypothetical protein